MSSYKIIIIYLFIPFLLLNCGTTVGFHDESIRKSIDFGEEQELSVCVFYENGITTKELNELEKDWAEEFGLYKIKLKFSRKEKVERFAFFGLNVLDQLYNYKLSKDCHRIAYLVSRTWGDAVWEIFTLGIFFGVGLKFEIHGAVENETFSRGFMKVKYTSLLQFIFTSPSSTLIHEGYHLLGCGHALWKDKCYRIIQSAKDINSRIPGDMYPLFSNENKFLFKESDKVNNYIGSKIDFPEEKKIQSSLNN
jgi:hypothetical protein